MSRKATFLLLATFSAATVGADFAALPASAANDPVFYPAKGQSQSKMEKDKYSCYEWAKGQTGFDPTNPAASSAPAPAAPRTGAARGAARGAAVGAIAGDAGKGAAVGAGVGAVRKRRGEKKAAEQQAASTDQQRSAYNRAVGACMEGKGYTVK